MEHTNSQIKKEFLVLGCLQIDEIRCKSFLESSKPCRRLVTGHRSHSIIGWIHFSTWKTRTLFATASRPYRFFIQGSLFFTEVQSHSQSTAKRIIELPRFLRPKREGEFLVEDPVGHSQPTNHSTTKSIILSNIETAIDCRGNRFNFGSQLLFNATQILLVVTGNEVYG